jgi:hypothetical protein
MKPIKVTNSQEYNQVLTDYKKLYNCSVDELKELANDESQAFVKRRLVQLITSEDEKLAFNAITWLHGIVSGENLHLNVVENIVTKPTGTFNLSANAFEIYTQLRKDNRGVQPGDDYLLKLLAVNIDYFNQITESINIGGFKMKFKTGAQQVRPEFSVYREVTENIQKIIKELGLNSLTKIKNKIDASIGPIDPLNDIL